MLDEKVKATNDVLEGLSHFVQKRNGTVPHYLSDNNLVGTRCDNKTDKNLLDSEPVQGFSD